LQLYNIKEEVDRFLYGADPESKITYQTRELFLKTFFLMHDYFAFLLKTKKNIEVKQAFELMIFFGYQIKYYRGFHLNVEFLIRTMVDKYGQESVINICEAHV
jgi:hypothetical protein